MKTLKIIIDKKEIEVYKANILLATSFIFAEEIYIDSIHKFAPDLIKKI